VPPQPLMYWPEMVVMAQAMQAVLPIADVYVSVPHDTQAVYP